MCTFKAPSLTPPLPPPPPAPPAPDDPKVERPRRAAARRAAGLATQLTVPGQLQTATTVAQSASGKTLLGA